MKQQWICAVVAAMTFLAVACKKGDVGPAGPAGNANVVQYSFPGNNFTSISSINLGITTTADTMNRSAYLIYLVRASGNTYQVPGRGLSGDSEYRMLLYYSGGKANITITRQSGPGEDYASIRVIRIYSNAVLPGGRFANPVVDWSNYDAVCAYYGLTPLR